MKFLKYLKYVTVIPQAIAYMVTLQEYGAVLKAIDAKLDIAADAKTGTRLDTSEAYVLDKLFDGLTKLADRLKKRLF